MLNKSERGEIVMILVDAALEQPPQARANYLQSACSGDPVLRGGPEAHQLGRENS